MYETYETICLAPNRCRINFKRLRYNPHGLRGQVLRYCSSKHHAYARTLRSIRTFLEAAPSETTWRNWRNVSLNGKCSLLLSHAWWLTSAYRFVDIETSWINGLEANQKSEARKSDQIYDPLHVDVIVKFLWTPNRLVDVIHRTAKHATKQLFICELLKASSIPQTFIVPIRQHSVSESLREQLLREWK